MLKLVRDYASVLLLAAALLGLPAAAETPAVIGAEARLVAFPLAVEGLGTARARESVEIRPELSERITAIRFEEGQRVEAGQVLVELEARELRAAVAVARATLVESDGQLRRARELHATNSLSDQELESRTARRAADRAALDAAEARLDQTVVRAPFAGRLGLRRVSPGSYVIPSTIITTLDDTEVMKIDFDVPETALSRLAERLPVTARSAAWPDEPFEGQVETIDTRVDPLSRTVIVRAVVDNPEGRLRPGMFLTVTALREDVTALVVPEQAILPEQSTQYVLVVGGNGNVEKREVRTGRRRPGQVEILSGLAEGEVVIAEGTQKARPGSSVEVVGWIEVPKTLGASTEPRAVILSDLSVRRPVFATVLSLLLVVLGLAALATLPVRQYPDIDPPVVSIDTTYRGASAEVIETKITQVIEDRIAGLEGIEKLSSSSRDEQSSIRVEFSLDRDVDEAANDIRDRISRVLEDLPDEADPPEIAKVDNDTRAVMYLNLTSDRLNGLEITDYADRFLTDRFSTVPGVARVRISGERRYAMRIWLDRERLAAHGLTVTDVEDALRAENVELPAGRLESREREFTLRTDTGFTTPEEFRRLAVGRGADGQVVHLAEVAEVRVGAENERNLARANGIPAVSLAIEQRSRANTVDVSKGVRAEAEKVARDLPEGMRIELNYDRAAFIEASMREVVKALVIAIVLVLVVIYLFLGDLRATLLPAVVVPVSVIATFLVMAALGYTVNTLTLLGLVLAIGLVVDDAIVVLENIYRRIEEGRPALLAALEGSKEIGFAVVATTLVLVAVFVPLSFIQGDVGRLFGEFGITLAAAVGFSSLVALTLSPMMGSKLLRPHGAGAGEGGRRGLAAVVDSFFQRLASRYKAVVARIVAKPRITLVAAAAISAAAALLYAGLSSEYAPQEDRGIFLVLMRAPEGASFEYTDRYARQMEQVLMQEIEEGPALRILLRLPARFGSTGEVNSARAIVILRPWGERDEHVSAVAARVRQELATLPGVRIAVITPQGLGIRSDGRPVSLVVGGPDYEQLRGWRDELLGSMAALPELDNPDSNYQERKPQLRVRVDRDRASALGVSLAAVGRTLETMLGSRVVTTYVDRGSEYDVVLQGLASDRASPDDLSNLYVRSSRTDRLVPLANLVRLEEEAGPDQLSRFDRMRAITVSAALTEGTSLGDAVNALETRARQVLPASARLTWDGESRELRESGSSLLFTFVLALVIVFLVLAAQFESFVHPVIILMTVPLALIGALLGLHLYGASVNVFTQIGAILLIGLAAKNGVLMVEFANQLRDRGRPFEEAVAESAEIRLRPILMTSACTTFGALPLLLATGAGAESRQAIGIVVVFGVAVSAVLTLFVVPAFYAALARGTRSPQHVARLIAALRRAEAPPASETA